MRRINSNRERSASSASFAFNTVGIVPRARNPAFDGKGEAAIRGLSARQGRRSRDTRAASPSAARFADELVSVAPPPAHDLVGENSRQDSESRTSRRGLVVGLTFAGPLSRLAVSRFRQPGCRTHVRDEPAPGHRILDRRRESGAAPLAADVEGEGRCPGVPVDMERSGPRRPERNRRPGGPGLPRRRARPPRPQPRRRSASSSRRVPPGVRRRRASRRACPAATA